MTGTTRQEDIGQVEHAVVQAEYAEAGGKFTARSSEKIRAAIRLLREVVRAERRRR